MSSCACRCGRTGQRTICINPAYLQCICAHSQQMSIYFKVRTTQILKYLCDWLYLFLGDKGKTRRERIERQVNKKGEGDTEI